MNNIFSGNLNFFKKQLACNRFQIDNYLVTIFMQVVPKIGFQFLFVTGMLAKKKDLLTDGLLWGPEFLAQEFTLTHWEQALGMHL